MLAGAEGMQSHSVAKRPQTKKFVLINLYAGKSQLRVVDHRDHEPALVQNKANANTYVVKNSAAALSPSQDQK